MSLGKIATFKIEQNELGQHKAIVTIREQVWINWQTLDYVKKGKPIEVGLNGPGKSKAIKKIRSELRHRGIEVFKVEFQS